MLIITIRAQRIEHAMNHAKFRVLQLLVGFEARGKENTLEILGCSYTSKKIMVA
jgi:hypothetical protein